LICRASVEEVHRELQGMVFPTLLWASKNAHSQLVVFHKNKETEIQKLLLRETMLYVLKERGKFRLHSKVLYHLWSDLFEPLILVGHYSLTGREEFLSAVVETELLDEEIDSYVFTSKEETNSTYSTFEESSSSEFKSVEEEEELEESSIISFSDEESEEETYLSASAEPPCGSEVTTGLQEESEKREEPSTVSLKDSTEIEEELYFNLDAHLAVLDKNKGLSNEVVYAIATHTEVPRSYWPRLMIDLCAIFYKQADSLVLNQFDVSFFSSIPPSLVPSLLYYTERGFLSDFWLDLLLRSPGILIRDGNLAPRFKGVAKEMAPSDIVIGESDFRQEVIKYLVDNVLEVTLEIPSNVKHDFGGKKGGKRKK